MYRQQLLTGKLVTLTGVCVCVYVIYKSTQVSRSQWGRLNWSVIYFACSFALNACQMFVYSRWLSSRAESTLSNWTTGKMSRSLCIQGQGQPENAKRTKRGHSERGPVDWLSQVIYCVSIRTQGQAPFCRQVTLLQEHFSITLIHYSSSWSSLVHSFSLSLAQFVWPVFAFEFGNCLASSFTFCALRPRE